MHLRVNYALFFASDFPYKMKTLAETQALIIDMDGVLWHGNQALPGLNDFFNTLRKLHLPFILATNNARSTPQQYVKKLAQMDVKVSESEILTSAMATATYLANTNDPDQTQIYVIGEAGACEALIEHGFSLCDTIDFDNAKAKKPKPADIVVSGLDKNLSWQKLATATHHIMNGADFIATNGDTTLPTEFGLAPGNGATIAALQAATGATPTIIGKPEPIMYQQAISLLGADATHTVAIGDRLNTDILGAIRAKIQSILVLTGVSNEQDIASTGIEPTWILQDITAVNNALIEHCS